MDFPLASGTYKIIVGSEACVSPFDVIDARATELKIGCKSVKSERSDLWGPPSGATL